MKVLNCQKALEFGLSWFKTHTPHCTVLAFKLRICHGVFISFIRSSFIQCAILFFCVTMKWVRQVDICVALLLISNNNFITLSPLWEWSQSWKIFVQTACIIIQWEFLLCCLLSMPYRFFVTPGKLILAQKRWWQTYCIQKLKYYHGGQ